MAALGAGSENDALDPDADPSPSDVAEYAAQQLALNADAEPDDL